jgi:hypothetical protein
MEIDCSHSKCLEKLQMAKVNALYPSTESISCFKDLEGGPQDHSPPKRTKLQVH